MSGGTRTRVMSRPLKKPQAPATTIAAATAKGSGMPALPEHAEQDRRQAHDRADRQVDAAGDDDEGHRQRHQRHLGHQPALVQQVADRHEAIGEHCQHRKRHDQRDKEDKLLRDVEARAGGEVSAAVMCSSR